MPNLHCEGAVSCTEPAYSEGGGVKERCRVLNLRIAKEGGVRERCRVLNLRTAKEVV